MRHIERMRAPRISRLWQSAGGLSTRKPRFVRDKENGVRPGAVTSDGVQPNAGAICFAIVSRMRALCATPSWFGTVKRIVLAARTASSAASSAAIRSGSPAYVRPNRGPHALQQPDLVALAPIAEAVTVDVLGDRQHAPRDRDPRHPLRPLPTAAPSRQDQDEPYPSAPAHPHDPVRADQGRADQDCRCLPTPRACGPYPGDRVRVARRRLRAGQRHCFGCRGLFVVRKPLVFRTYRPLMAKVLLCFLFSIPAVGIWRGLKPSSWVVFGDMGPSDINPGRVISRFRCHRRPFCGVMSWPVP
jgi:hypothetical protein